ncbi:kynureninase [Neomegalonema sp.]|uniref:kynureninase/PvdN C-terminal domain-containing protein n=1 Tax=Neomegalonema sp. TaxID=2039713 RepID=UPI002617C447|nr:kynureninase [Neomegalonema sp.]MDD2868533.1 kynureninase [Neomegalonema sp.]
MKTDFSATRALFDQPEGLIHLDGGSLGPPPRAAQTRLAEAVGREWGDMLRGGPARAAALERPRRLGDRIARLIGAEPGSVVVGDSFAVKLHQALISALRMNAGRRAILAVSGSFPPDLHAAQDLVRSLGPEHELRVVEPEGIAKALDEDVAALIAPDLDHRTGRRHDMAALTTRAHAAGALAIRDLSRSAGASPLRLAQERADFAVGRTCGHLNSGPGGPAFIYVAPRHAATAHPGLSGPPPLLQTAALEAALEVWDQVEMKDLRARALELADRFIAGVEAACPDLVLVTPRAHEERGSQLNFRHPEGRAILEALEAEGVTGGLSAPDLLRFSFAPLHLGPEEVDRAVEILARIMAGKLGESPEAGAGTLAP